MNYLYPDNPTHVEQVKVPHLQLPLRVGVAFVPPGSGGSSWRASPNLTERDRSELLKSVAERFEVLPFVGKVEIIPSAYLRSGGSFENLDQIRSMFGVDVIALVAYDQIQFTEHNLLAVTYLTIVGAYIMHGDHNSTETLMDAVVFDIASRQMLFRAPGTSKVSGFSTAAAIDSRLRENSRKGFELATVELIENLEHELENFKVRIRERPSEVRVSHREGYDGSGAYHGWLAILLAGLMLWARRRRG